MWTKMEGGSRPLTLTPIVGGPAAVLIEGESRFGGSIQGAHRDAPRQAHLSNCCGGTVTLTMERGAL